MSSAYLEAVKNRRTYYLLKKESPIDDQKIEDIVGQALLHTPSSFNSQSTRVLLLLKDEHDKLWEIAKTALKAAVSAEKWSASELKLNLFQGAYGTVSYLPLPPRPSSRNSQN
jgi:uncharacterized protein